MRKSLDSTFRGLPNAIYFATTTFAGRRVFRNRRCYDVVLVSLMAQQRAIFALPPRRTRTLNTQDGGQATQQSSYRHDIGFAAGMMRKAARRRCAISQQCQKAAQFYCVTI